MNSQHSFENKYGKLVLQVVGPYQEVSTLHSKEFDKSCFFTIDEAEKIALITGNAGIQLGFPMWDPTHKTAYVIHHSSASVAALCRIVSLEFVKDVNAREVLARPDSYRRIVGF